MHTVLLRASLLDGNQKHHHIAPEDPAGVHGKPLLELRILKYFPLRRLLIQLPVILQLQGFHQFGQLAVGTDGQTAEALPLIQRIDRNGVILQDILQHS